MEISGRRRNGILHKWMDGFYYCAKYSASSIVAQQPSTSYIIHMYSHPSEGDFNLFNRSSWQENPWREVLINCYLRSINAPVENQL